jgi:hypothetical protein
VDPDQPGDVADPLGDRVGDLDAGALGEEERDDSVALPHVDLDADVLQGGLEVGLQPLLEELSVVSLEDDLAQFEQNTGLAQSGHGHGATSGGASRGKWNHRQVSRGTT